MPTVLVPLAEGFEEIETLAPVDLLRRAGIETVVASLAETRHATGRCGVTIHADRTLGDAASGSYDMIFLPGGPGTKLLRADERIRSLVRQQHERRAWLAAICAAPTVLADQGLLEGKRFTAHFSVAAELPSALWDERVVTDGHITTSRGAGTAIDFGLHLVTLLSGAEKSADVSKAICF